MTDQPALLFSERKKTVFLNALKDGQTVRAAAARAGVDRSTIYHHMAKDSTFASKVAQARDEAEARLLDAITKAAHTGDTVTTPGGTVTVRPGDWKAAAWLLEHHPHTRERYATLTKMQMGGDPDNPTPILTETVVDVGPSTIERLGQVVGILARAGKVRYPEPGEPIVIDVADGGVTPVDAPDEQAGPS